MTAATSPQIIGVALIENRTPVAKNATSGAAKSNTKAKPKLDRSVRLRLTALSDTHYASAILAQTPRRYWASGCWHPMAISAGTTPTKQGHIPHGCWCWHPTTGKPAGRVFSAKSPSTGASHACRE